MNPVDLCGPGYFCTGKAQEAQPPDTEGGPCTAGNFCPEGSSNMLPCTPGMYCQDARMSDILYSQYSYISKI